MKIGYGSQFRMRFLWYLYAIVPLKTHITEVKVVVEYSSTFNLVD